MTDVRLAQYPGARDDGLPPPPLKALRDAVEGEVRAGRHDRLLYATDASIYEVPPLAVVIPRHEADVIAAMQVCAEHDLPVLPRGGGTSLAGQAVGRAVIIDVGAHLRDVLSIDVDAMRARVQPGVVLDGLNAELAPHGLMFGPDVATSSHATIGGMIGNNSAGARSVRYGRTVEHVRGIDALLADGRRLQARAGAAREDDLAGRLTTAVLNVIEPLAGTIDARFPKTRRRVNGYNLDLILQQMRSGPDDPAAVVNLADLLCGSEGTLGVTLSAEIDLVRRPACVGLAIIAYPGVDAALSAVTDLLRTEPSAIELVDQMILDLARGNREHRRYVELMPEVNGAGEQAVLYVEYSADGEGELHDRLDALAQVYGAARMRRYTDAGSMAAAWKLRKAGEPLLYGATGRRKPLTFIEDLAVDPSVIVEFIRAFRELVSRHGTTAAYYAHASVGCLHLRPLIDLHSPDDRRTMEALATDATDLVMQFGGALSGEHGDGRLRSHLLERFYGPEICDAFARIKTIFDPGGRLNPGNIVDGPKMTEHLRTEPPETLADLPTHFRYAREGGLHEAARMCNGAGICRRLSGGTMCPSYRATLDERHATRGRGNALRMAISGDGRPDWNDPETLATLDLCLSCKACKSECPSNVDVARLKAEYTAWSYAARGRTPLDVRLLGHTRELFRVASLAPGLANGLAQGPLGRLGRRVSRIDTRRSLPAFGPSLRRWHRRRVDRHRPGASAPTVVLFADCFTAFGESHIGRAAVTALETLGCSVIVPELGCCGRPQISNGLLGAARRTARRTALRLESTAVAHDAIAAVVAEPSCLSAITDDWTDLRLGLDPQRVNAIAGRCTSVESFVLDRLPDAPPDADGSPVLLHGHCHEKALAGLDDPRAVLQRVVGDRLQVLDTGCCGMAGAWGYDPAHFDLSMTIAELSLLPALRAGHDAIAVTAGTSCRHQIRDALGREAMHPVQLVAQWLHAEA